MNQFKEFYQGKRYHEGDRRLLPARSASAPTTSTASARTAVTSPSSRCSATSPSAASPSSRPAPGPSSSSTEELRPPSEDRLPTSPSSTDDDETHRRCAAALGVAEDHISRLGEDDNFWRRRPHRPLRPLLRDLLRSGPRGGLRQAPTASRAATATASWSTGTCVFTQYDRQEDGTHGRRCRTKQPRHRHGPGAHGCHPAAQERQLRRRPHAVPHRPRREHFRQEVRG